jgi:hypothetical protein
MPIYTIHLTARSLCASLLRVSKPIKHVFVKCSENDGLIEDESTNQYRQNASTNSFRQFWIVVRAVRNGRRPRGSDQKNCRHGLIFQGSVRTARINGRSRPVTHDRPLSNCMLVADDIAPSRKIALSQLKIFVDTTNDVCWCGWRTIFMCIHLISMK